MRRRMIGQVTSAIENLGLSILHLVQKILNEDEATALYKEHIGKWHFNRNIRHIISGPCVVIHVQGTDAFIKCREMVKTYREAHSDLIKLPANLVHATSDENKALEELKAVGCL
ncbi:MAG: nucleoside-diphosphate kinase [Promethearchaeota archaeon]